MCSCVHTCMHTSMVESIWGSDEALVVAIVAVEPPTHISICSRHTCLMLLRWHVGKLGTVLFAADGSDNLFFVTSACFEPCYSVAWLRSPLQAK